MQCWLAEYLIDHVILLGAVITFGPVSLTLSVLNDLANHKQCL